MANRKPWTVKFDIEFVPCPPEHAAAYWAAWRTLFEMAKKELAKQEAIKAAETNTVATIDQ